MWAGSQNGTSPVGEYDLISVLNGITRLAEDAADRTPDAPIYVYGAFTERTTSTNELPLNRILGLLNLVKIDNDGLRQDAYTRIGKLLHRSYPDYQANPELVFTNQQQTLWVWTDRKRMQKSKYSKEQVTRIRLHLLYDPQPRNPGLNSGYLALFQPDNWVEHPDSAIGGGRPDNYFPIIAPDIADVMPEPPPSVTEEEMGQLFGVGGIQPDFSEFLPAPVEPGIPEPAVDGQANIGATDTDLSSPESDAGVRLKLINDRLDYLKSGCLSVDFRVLIGGVSQAAGQLRKLVADAPGRKPSAVLIPNREIILSRRILALGASDLTLTNIDSDYDLQVLLETAKTIPVPADANLLQAVARAVDPKLTPDSNTAGYFERRKYALGSVKSFSVTALPKAWSIGTDGLFVATANCEDEQQMSCQRNFLIYLPANPVR
ncbi:hypothetical protein A2Z33_03915 [Candidatus Gottesmanbacteria bacterium RBG_16_52_11]|uniref:Uncharacterized protein n=1 Tax=Candidatus Gottesmanbacteria bacterium RBG_16_52_11 TaxID=1798374 RepID=A0A1F5YVP3_9BACT|nr:MAG: hypothetical protein A2Z33_03915 [Candidatus Gottesmanbacteria bacterium RBG_16_52_11]